MIQFSGVELGGEAESSTLDLLHENLGDLLDVILGDNYVEVPGIAHDESVLTMLQGLEGDGWH